MPDVENAPQYLALVRHYHPQGYPTGWYAGCTKRRAGKRVTDLCQHRHATAEEALTCATRLAAKRNGTTDA